MLSRLCACCRSRSSNIGADTNALSTAQNQQQQQQLLDPYAQLRRNDPLVTQCSNSDYGLGDTNAKLLGLALHRTPLQENNDKTTTTTASGSGRNATAKINTAVTHLHVNVRRMTPDGDYGSLLTWIAESPSLQRVTLSGSSRDMFVWNWKPEMAVVDRFVRAIISSGSDGGSAALEFCLQNVWLGADAYYGLCRLPQQQRQQQQHRATNNVDTVTTRDNKSCRIKKLTLELCVLRQRDGYLITNYKSQSSTFTANDHDRLQQLCLRIVDVDDALQISAGLGTTTLLNELSIMNTERRSETSVAISNALGLHLTNSLVHLELGYVQFRGPSFALLCKGLGSACSLQNLTVKGCSFLEESGIARFENVFRTNRNISVLAFRGSVRFGARGGRGSRVGGSGAATDSARRSLAKLLLRMLTVSNKTGLKEIDLLGARGSLLVGDITSILQQQTTTQGLETLRFDIEGVEQVHALTLYLPNLKLLSRLELHIISMAGVTATDKAAFLAAFRLNTSLLEVEITDELNFFGASDRAMIEFCTALRNRFEPLLLPEPHRKVPLSLVPEVLNLLKTTKMGSTMMLLALRNLGGSIGARQGRSPTDDLLPFACDEGLI